LKLYHFTSANHVQGCLRDGITLGMIPVLQDGKIGVIPDWQWLTANPSFQQEWANSEFSFLPYDRTECRLTVIIPKSACKNLFRWLDICDKLPAYPGLNDFGDLENWYVFRGRIKAGWIRKVDLKNKNGENGRQAMQNM